MKSKVNKSVNNDLKNKSKRINKNVSKKSREVEVNDTKKSNIFISQLKEYFSFYKENLKKKHIIIYIISLIIFFIFLSLFISNIDVTTQFSKVAENANKSTGGISLFKAILRGDVFTAFLVIFAGITPFIHLSAIGFVYPYILAGDISGLFASSSTPNLIFATIGNIISIFGIALAIAAGFLYCSYTTKKFRYTQGGNFGILDIKRHYYDIRKNEEKVAKIDEEKNKKAKKKEKLNVKVPYKMLLYSFIFSSVILIIGTLLSNI